MKVDDRDRIALPRAHQDLFPERSTVRVGPAWRKRALNIMPDDAWEKVAGELQEGTDPAEFEASGQAQKRREFYRVNYEQETVQGTTRRINLPKSWVKDLELLDENREVVVLGQFSYLQVVSTATYRETCRRALAGILDRESQEVDD